MGSSDMASARQALGAEPQSIPAVENNDPRIPPTGVEFKSLSLK